MPTFTNLRPTTPHFPPSAVESMLSLVSSAPIPPRPPFPTSNDPILASSSSAPQPPKEWELGVEYDYLLKLRDKWLHEWRWESLSQRLGGMDHYLVDYADPIDENGEERYELTLHFVHQRSTREDAIPLLILHGWPGTFFDFHKIIDPLVDPPHPSLTVPLPPLTKASTHSTPLRQQRTTSFRIARIIGYHIRSNPTAEVEAARVV